MNLLQAKPNKCASLILMLVFTFLTGITTYAQPPGGGQRGGQQGPPPVPNSKQIKTMVSDLAKDISLTDKQEASVLLLYNEHFEAVNEETSGNARPNREKMEALQSTLEKNVKAQLTADQQKAYTAWLKKQNSQRQRR